MLVVTDVFTKYAFAFPTKNELATTVAKLLVDNIFSVFGIPENLLSDQGRNFESEVIKQLCCLLDIKKIFTCPYSPRSDAICERFNRTMIDMLGTLNEEKKDSWSKHLLHMCNMYNSSTHSSTGFSPFELIFGRKSRLPVDLFMGTNPLEAEFSSIKEYVRSLKSKLEFTHELARQNMDMSHLRNKHRYDQKVNELLLKPGDRVLVKNVGLRGPHKLSTVWLPHVYRVIREVHGNPRVYELESVSHSRRKNRVLHVDMLKKINDLERLHARTHVPGYLDIESSDDDFDDHALGKLFGDDAGPELTIPVQQPGKSKTHENRKVDRRAYNLRSRSRNDHPKGLPAETESDLESVLEPVSEDEMSLGEGLKLHDPSGTPKHASSPSNLQPDQYPESDSDENDNRLSESPGHTTDVADIGGGDRLEPDFISPIEERGDINDLSDDDARDESAVDMELVAETTEVPSHINTPSSEGYMDSSESDDCAQSNTSPAGIGRRLPARQRSKPAWYGDVFSHVLWGNRPTVIYGQVTEI